MIRVNITLCTDFRKQLYHSIRLSSTMIVDEDEHVDTTINSHPHCCAGKLMTRISCNRNTSPSSRLFRTITYTTKLSCNMNTSPSSRLFKTVTYKTKLSCNRNTSPSYRLFRTITYTTKLSCNRNTSPSSRLFRTVTYTTKQSRKRLFLVLIGLCLYDITY